MALSLQSHLPSQVKFYIRVRNPVLKMEEEEVDCTAGLVCSCIYTNEP